MFTALRNFLNKLTGHDVKNVTETTFERYIGALVYSGDWGFGRVVELERTGLDNEVWVTAAYLDMPSMRWNMPAQSVYLIDRLEV